MVRALQPFVAVASVLLRFVLLFPRIRRLNVSAVTAILAAGHNSRQFLHCCPPPAPLTTTYRTAMRRKRNLCRVRWVCPEVPLVVDRSTRGLAVAWLLHRNPLTRLPASSPARRQGRTRTGAAVIIRRDEHVHRGTGLVLLAAR